MDKITNFAYFQLEKIEPNELNPILIKKMKVMYDDPCVSVDSQEIKWVHQYTYLGQRLELGSSNQN